MRVMAKRDIESHANAGKDRVYNPPVGLMTPDTDPEVGAGRYAHDPHIDPQLSWAGKAEHASLEVPTVSLHVHERVDPRTIIEEFGNYADVGFAVILPTPDDVGAPAKTADELRARARQHVNPELGFFLGKLSRDRVCVPVKGDVETPSDYDGIADMD